MKEFIALNYKDMSYRQMADKLNTTFNTISTISKELIQEGRIERKNKRWATEDDIYLLRNYRILDHGVIAKELETTTKIVKNRYHTLSKGKMEETLKNKIAKDKLEEEKVNAVFKRLMEQNVPIAGLNLNDLKLKVGQAYKIKTTERNITETFEGKLIQICDKHLVFRGKNGRCESFLKVDLLLEHKYEEVK